MSRPSELRANLGDYLPPFTFKGKHWHKGPGFSGVNKNFHGTCCPQNSQLQKYEDVQQHVDGIEYRINTAGGKIVQAHKKTPLEGDGFMWEWCGVDALKNKGILPVVKSALKEVPHYVDTVLGWDVIYTPDKTYILEVNTSPGVNEPTARRILEALNVGDTEVSELDSV